MGFLVSPGVEVKEIDLTNSIPALSTSIGGYAGQFKWGPIDQIVSISSEKQLAQVFGAPTVNDQYAASYFTAASFLNYSNSLKVVRAYAESATNGYDDGLSLTDPYDTEPLGFPISSEDDLIDPGIYAKYPGEFGNDIEVNLVTGGNYSLVDTSIKSNLTYTPAQTDFCKNIVADGVTINDEVSVVIIDKSGKFTGTPGAVLEVFEGLSFATNAKLSDGTNNNIDAVLNRSSQYVWAQGLASNVFQGTDFVLTASSSDLQFNIPTEGSPSYRYTTNGGSDGEIAAANIQTALGYFEDSESVDVNFLFAQSGFTGQATINGKIITIADQRKDLLGFISAPLNLYTEINTNKLTKVKAEFSALGSTSYAVFDSSPVQMYNKYADLYVWVPASGHMAGLCANTDDVAEPWFSPAGYNRGQLRGVSKLAFNPNQSDRDELYKLSINPIVSFPGQGIILFGDKTALKRPSAFSHINVRRLFITLQKAIATFAKFSLFELNDDFTRSAFTAAVEPYLRDVQGRRGIIDFKVVCDTSNNTPVVIDSNRFVADIYIKPERSINYITLNFIATRTGVEFKEIVGG